AAGNVFVWREDSGQPVRRAGGISISEVHHPAASWPGCGIALRFEFAARFLHEGNSVNDDLRADSGDFRAWGAQRQDANPEGLFAGVQVRLHGDGGDYRVYRAGIGIDRSAVAGKWP